jgi:hypothetical protein
LTLPTMYCTCACSYCLCYTPLTPLHEESGHVLQTRSCKLWLKSCALSGHDVYSLKYYELQAQTIEIHSSSQCARLEEDWRVTIPQTRNSLNTVCSLETRCVYDTCDLNVVVLDAKLRLFHVPSVSTQPNGHVILWNQPPLLCVSPDCTVLTLSLLLSPTLFSKLSYPADLRPLAYVTSAPCSLSYHLPFFRFLFH